MSKANRKSRWEFDNSQSLGGSGFFVSVLAGSLFLKDPSGVGVKFDYASLGTGLSYGLKMDRSLGFSPNASVGGSQKELPNAGQIWLLDSFSGPDLSASDIEGFSIITELSIFGSSGTGMLLGIPLRDLPREGLKRGLVGSYLDWAASDDEDRGGMAPLGILGVLAISGFKDEIREFFDTGGAKALLLIASSGVGTGIGVTQTVGYVSMSVGASISPYSPLDIIMGPDEMVITKSSNTAQVFAILVPSDALFDSGESSIKLSAEAILKKAGALIRTHPDSLVVISGHTDSTGRPDHNLFLSIQRATSVTHWLTSRHYMDGQKVSPMGIGQAKPVASNNDAVGRAKNRRVEIQVFAGGR